MIVPRYYEDALHENMMPYRAYYIPAFRPIRDSYPFKVAKIWDAEILCPVYGVSQKRRPKSKA